MSQKDLLRPEQMKDCGILHVLMAKLPSIVTSCLNASI